MISFMKTLPISKICNTNVEVITKGVTFKLRGIMCIKKKPVNMYKFVWYNFIKVIY